MENAKKVLIISHSTNLKGPIDHLEDFLIKQNFLVVKLVHPLDVYNNRWTILTENYKEQKKVKRSSFPMIVNIVIDFIINIQSLIKEKNIQIIIGANNFDTFSSIIFRLISGKKDIKIVYFGSDYSEKRFHNFLLDNIYLLIEKITIKYSNLTVSNTQRATNARNKLGLLPTNSLTISNGVTLVNEVFKEKLLSKNRFIYVGTVSKEHGLYELIDVISPIIEELTIIGSGDDWDRVKKLCESKSFKSEFLFNQPHDFVINKLQSFCGFGLSPYNKSSRWTYFCSPLKINEYISCGVPVITSDVPEISEMISKLQLGVVYSVLDLNDISTKLERMEVKEFNVKAETFYHQHSYDNLYKLLVKYL